jgi:uncharacterized protein
MTPVLPSTHDDASPSITSRRRSPLAFVVLVFALALPFWLIGAMTGIQLTPDLPVSALQFVCPAIAAVLLVSRQNGSAGVSALLRRAFDYRRIRPKVWHLPVVLLPLGIYGVTYGVLHLTGAPLSTSHVPMTAALVMCMVFFVAALGEEVGWTGYALAPLQARWSALQTSLLIGLVWAVWHLVPLVQAHRSLEWIAWWSLGTMATRVLIVWLYANTRQSVFAAILFHAMANLCQVGPFLNFGPNGYPIDALRIAGLILTAVAAAVTVMWGPQTLARYRSQSRVSIAPSFGRIPADGTRC